MALTNNLKKQVDLPVWEWMRFAPINTQTVSYLTAADAPKDSRYLYYYSTGFWRYDTWTDQWTQLQTPITTPATIMAMKYSNECGFRGRIISGTTNTVLAPALTGNIFSGETIRIYGGTGSGQVRQIVNVQDQSIYDSGIVTSASVLAIGDTTKKWKINQWSGYQCAIFGPSTTSQRRKILYNDTNTLYLADTNYQQFDPWNNTSFNAVAPYTAPITTAGSQTNYFIEASVITVDTPWSVVPDNTSRFMINTGGIWMISSVGTQFYNLQYYDIAADTWYVKTTNGAALFGGQIGTDISIERLATSYSLKLSGTTTTGSTLRTVLDTNLTGVTIDQYLNKQIIIVSGTGMGQRRRIISNTATSFTLNKKLDVALDNSSKYEISDDTQMLYISGSGTGGVLNYQIEYDMAASGPPIDYGMARNMGIRLQNSTWTGWDDIGITTATRSTGGIYTINTTPAVSGASYVVGEIVTLSGGAKVRVEKTTGNGAASVISLYYVGSGYSNTTYAQTSTTGSGTGLQVTVLSNGVVGRITTALSHFLRAGDPVVFNGATESAWNTTYNVLATDSLTTLDLAISATANATATASQTTSILVDSGQNWDINEHVGRLVGIYTAGAAPTGQIRRITANSSSTLTLQSTITAAVNGTSRYIIFDIASLGRDEQYKYLPTSKSNIGYATGGVSGTTGTLIDTTKDWFINQWANYKIRIISGTGFPNEMTIVSNSGTTLNLSGTTNFIADSTTKYQIMDTFGLCTSLGSATVLNDTNKNWTVNQWAGKRVRITSGTGNSVEVTITSNTATQLVVGSGMGSPTTDSTYVILSLPTRGLGTCLLYTYGNSNYNKYLYSFRGGAFNSFDIYDISKETWNYGNFYSPQSETLTTGSMYAYDGLNTIYFTKDATGRIYAYNIVSNKVSAAGQIPYGMSTAIVGNRMEIITTEDGLKYLYIMRHSAGEMFRTLLLT